MHGVTVFRITMSVNYNCFKTDRNDEIEVSLVKKSGDWSGETEKRRGWRSMVNIDPDCNRLSNCERADTMPEDPDHIINPSLIDIWNFIL